jgi:chaperonin GroES
MTDDRSLEDAFPAVDPGMRPLGSRVLVQIKTAQEKTKGGIILTNEDRSVEKWNTQVGKVVSLGPLAFHNRNTAELWPEGAWVKEGDFVRVAKYGGDRFEVNDALFVVFNDLDLIAVVTSDPLAIKSFF